MSSWDMNEEHREHCVRMTKVRLVKAAIMIERYADQIRQLAEGDRLESQNHYGQAVANTVGDLGNVLANARMEDIVQVAAQADTYRELVRLQRELEAERGE